MDAQTEARIRAAVEEVLDADEMKSTKINRIMLIIIDDVASPEYERGLSDGQFNDGYGVFGPGAAS